ncbi:MAG: hypothetical protein FJY07_06450 [Bacteroidetes bacterium]|nr:hypothetical protein [Bacteroidota bacterium]
MERSNIINLLESAIEQFSKFLSSDLSNWLLIAYNNREIFDLSKEEWKSMKFPGTSGVYLIFGNSDKLDNAIYIGKASYTSTIGYRLDYHLNNPARNLKKYPMLDKQGRLIMMDKVITISMVDYWFFAPALEEFLINYMHDNNVPLINIIGKYEI